MANRASLSLPLPPPCVCSLCIDTQHFKALLQQLGDIYLKHTRNGLLKNCARTFKALLTREHALKNISDPSFTALTDELTEKLLELMPKFQESVRYYTALDVLAAK